MVLSAAALPIEVRAFEHDDLEAVVNLVGRTIETSYATAYPPRAIDFFKTFHAPADIARRARDGLVLVAVRGDAIIGTGSLLAGEIFAVFIDPAEQGNGLGRALMERLENAAMAEGRRRSDLDVSLPSRRFYERLGYVMTEECEHDLEDGQKLRFWKASKNLADGATPAASG